MANVKISDLPAASTPLSGTELVPIVQSGITSQTTVGGLLGGPNGSNLAGFLQSGTSAVATTVQAKLRETVSVFDFMTAAQIAAVQSGASNDVTTAVQNAITYATANKNTLIFPAGTYKFPSLTAALQFDLGNMSAVADGNVTLDFSGTSAAGQYAIWLYSSLSYPVSHYQNTTHKFEGFVCKGAGAGGINGLLIKHNTYTSNCQFETNSCSFYNFDTNLYLETNAWRLAFNNCVFLLGHTQNISLGNGTNEGESIKFDHCMIADGGDFVISGSGITPNLYSTSILNTTLRITGSSNTVNLYGGNLENPGSALEYTYIHIQDGTSTNKVTVFGTPITVNATTWTHPLFYVGANNTLSFVNVTWPDINNYGQIATDTGYLQYVAGSGNVTASGCSYWPLGGGAKPIVSKLMNSVYNGDFETVYSSAVTISNASPAVVTWNSNNLSNGDAVIFSTTGALPTGLTAGTTYYVINVATNTFNVSATSGGAAINTSSAGSGTHTCVRVSSPIGWTVSPYGTAGSTAILSATAAKQGSYGLLVTTVASGGINVSQSFAVKPNQLVNLGCWAKVATAGGTPAGYFQVVFYSASGTQISSYSDSLSTVGSWVTAGASLTKYAPVGAASVTIILNAQASASANVIYFDNVALNIA